MLAWIQILPAGALGLYLEEVAQYNIEKLKRRYPDGFDAQHSLHREEGGSGGH